MPRRRTVTTCRDRSTRDGTACQRSTYAYPSLIASSKGLTLNFRACSGATVADVTTTQLGALGSGTTHVTISVGGNDAGFADVHVSPRMVYVDRSRPGLVDGFTRRTFTAMVEGVGERAVAEGLIDAESWARGIRDLYRTAEPDGTFCYTFFKAVARKP